MKRSAEQWKKWRIVSRDGNPDRKGTYEVLLIYELDGKKLAETNIRDFGQAEEAAGWIMADQPREGLVWEEQSGSIDGESVYAWIPMHEFPTDELPEGVEWDPHKPIWIVPDESECQPSEEDD